MADFDAELAYFSKKLSEKFDKAFLAGESLPGSAIIDVLTKDPFQLGEEGKEWIRRQLEHRFSVSQGTGAAVTKEYSPWLRKRQDRIEFFYWKRLKRFYLEENVLPPHVVAVLDSVTDEVLDYCGNPEGDSFWSRRGMVMGHVQSGKTTNYSALICKASDAGYKIIILMAGLTNSLRAQTQERIDAAFIGRKSVFRAAINEPLPIVSYGTGHRYPAYGTTRDQDFRRDNAAGYGVTLAALNEPIIFVTKKNKGTLENLFDWIRAQAHGGKIQYPLLMIDDEADNASINTAKDPKRVTAINEVIRKILSLFSRSSYVGYTATPFANIFIDPETDDSMLGDDLFPRHFIKALDPPSNYVGADRVFGDVGDLRSMVREVDDYSDYLPLNHKRDATIEELPRSLYEAIRVFVLSRAIRCLRGQQHQHSSMMINVSRFNDVQERVMGHVYGFIERLRDSIEVNARLGRKGLQDPELAALQAVFAAEYSSTEFAFEEIRYALPQAVGSIVARTINMRGGTLDYSRQSAEGLHVIAVGGLALSRGLTLEGLTVSYILRNTEASDTLMQMARWFGYRPSYEDVCRLYLPTISLDHYSYIAEAIAELTSEIKRMSASQSTPEQFGLKVRQSPTAIRVTAANKMRTATSVQLAQDYSGRHIEGYALFNDNSVNVENLKAVGRFIAQIGEEANPARWDAPASEQATQHRAWRKVPGRQIAQLIGAFKFPEAQPDLGRIAGTSSLFGDYVDDRIASELSNWDVIIPQPRAERALVEVAELGVSLRLRERSSGTADHSVFRVTGSKNRVADPNDAQLLLSRAEIDRASKEIQLNGGKAGDKVYCRARTSPLLLIHIFGSSTAKVNISGPIISLSFCTPITSVVPLARTYQVNAVYRKQLTMFAEESDDDEDYFEDSRNE